MNERQLRELKLGIGFVLAIVSAHFAFNVTYAVYAGLHTQTVRCIAE